MARCSVKDVCDLIWFMELKLDQKMKWKFIFQQSNLWQNIESMQWIGWDLSTKENCYRVKMETVWWQINMHENLVHATQS